jgi:alpha-L-rhamnosidase
LRQAPGSAGWESFVVAPVPHPSHTWAAGTHETPHGTIRVSWQAHGRDLRISVDVPPATTASIVFPDGATETVPAGAFSAVRPLPTAGRVS